MGGKHEMKYGQIREYGKFGAVHVRENPLGTRTEEKEIHDTDKDNADICLSCEKETCNGSKGCLMRQKMIREKK